MTYLKDRKKRIVKEGDYVRTTKRCGDTLEGKVYKVVKDRINDKGELGSGVLAINPVDHKGGDHSHCSCHFSWELLTHKGEIALYKLQT